MRYDKSVALDCCPGKLEMDYSVILNKPFLLPTTEWPSSADKFSILKSFKVPEEIILNELAEIPFKASVYYRAKVSLVLQVSGTPMHQGIILASALPISNFAYSSIEYVNSLMSAPHVFLNANESTSVVLEVPFYVNSVLSPINFDGTTFVPANRNANYAQVHLMVLNPLQVPTSGTTSVSISAHAVFKELEFYVPHVEPTWIPFPGFEAEGFLGDAFPGVKTTISKGFDSLASGLKFFAGDLLDKTREAACSAIDSGRQLVRTYTGLHNPEIPKLDGRMAVQTRQNLNLVDTPSFFEKLDPYGNFTKFVDDFVFDTSIDEMSLHEIISKPQYIGSFVVKSADPSGTILWSRPISPAQDAVQIQYNDSLGLRTTSGSSNLLQTFQKMSRFWKGTINVHIQSSMTNFHFCKLIIARNYSPDVNMLTSYPDFRDAANLMTETIEFSAGGQVQTVEMPFCSPMSMLPCSPDYIFNALSHGLYYIYLYQPLVINGTVPTSVEFNVYVSAGSDFEYYGYAVDPLRILKPFVQPSVLSEEASSINRQKLLSYEVESQTEAPTIVNAQETLSLSQHQEESDEKNHLRPIKHIRDYIRRFYSVLNVRLSANQLAQQLNTFSIPVSEILGFAAEADFEYASTLSIIKSMFLGYRGGFKLKILVNGSLRTAAWYVPPSYSLSEFTNWTSNDPVPSTVSSFRPILAEMFQFPNSSPPAANLQLGPTFASQTVSVETPNHVHTVGGQALSISSSGIPSTTTELEFEIPYMTPFKFIGNSDVLGITGEIPNALNDLGVIVFKVAAPFWFSPGASAAPADITIQVYASCTDESRLGFQVYAPFVAYGSRPSLNPADGNRFIVSSNDLQPGSILPPQAVLNSPVDLTPLYYTRSI
jgi:hypothetical protein